MDEGHHREAAAVETAGVSLPLLLDELARRGGVARRRDLPVGKRVLLSAVRAGVVRRERAGLYSSAGAERALTVARLAGGVRSHLSAASAYGWVTSEELHVAVRRGTRVSPAVASEATIHWRPLSAADLERGMTSPLDTAVDCLRDIGGAPGLAVGDAACRSGLVTVEELAAALARDRRRGVRAARALVREVTPLAESVLESHLRFLSLDVPGVRLAAQVRLGGQGWSARVDHADPVLGLVAEADSFTWHGSRAALARDAARYDRLVAAGWRVLRFSYEAVMGEPEWVRAQLAGAAAVQEAMCAAGVRPWRSSLRWVPGPECDHRWWDEGDGLP